VIDAVRGTRSRGLHARIGMEAPDHRAAEQDVGEGDERHALVVSHEGAHDRSPATAIALSRGQLVDRPVRVVDGVVIAVGTRAPFV
jgi:hypothetical protein